ncbi:hypothetical protein [Brevibacillus dissolubilis]|nr:hypothetical protein [Brevibacillus dissolubilis]
MKKLASLIVLIPALLVFMGAASAQTVKSSTPLPKNQTVITPDWDDPGW